LNHLSELSCIWPFIGFFPDFAEFFERFGALQLCIAFCFYFACTGIPAEKLAQ